MSAVDDGNDARGAISHAPSAVDALVARIDALTRLNAELTGRIAELENANRASRDSQLATLNVLEDAMASRQLADTLNAKLQVENEERRQAEAALRKSTEQLVVALEAAKAAHRAKDQFMAALSHELRTPLTPILLLAGQGAEDAKLPRHLRKRFNLIRANVEVEARLIDDLLDQTQIARGHIRLAKQSVNVHAVLADVLRTTASEFTRKHISITRSLRASATQVLADPVRLQQIFWNLLRNAAKFTPPQGSVTVSTADLGEHRVTVTICDTGIGLTPAEIQRVFEPFAQGDHADDAATHAGGLGLGLAISRKLAELHDGKLSVVSAGRGQGATFTLELPSVGCAVPAGASSPHCAGEAAAGASLRILLVEDHAPTRAALKTLLAESGHDIVATASSNEAVRASSEHPFDVVISDLGLPDESGWKMMQRLRMTRPGLPGIALSGYGMNTDIERSREAGFVTHLTKPVSVELLKKALTGIPRA